ncbi:MAG: hypothetical protein R2761_23640 [Acidimicrobiales bacterium]
MLTLYWMAIEQVPLVLGTSTSRTHAKESWRAVVDMAKANPYIEASTRETIGEEALIIGPSRYQFAASNRRAGRSQTVHRLIIDEIREHHNFEAWGAATNAMQAVPEAQAVCISNQGDSNAVVLDHLRQAALDYIETGTGDERTGLFEWSAPAGADVTDPEALAMANPDLGNRITLDTLMGQAVTAKAAGGEALASFRTEVLCQRVHQLDAAIDPASWEDGRRDALDLAPYRDRVALGLDVALDGSHVTLVAAAVVPGEGVLVDVVAAWEGHGSVALARQELPALVAKVAPRAVGWFPQGPAAALAADLREGWAPRGTELTPITADLTAVSMGLAQLVAEGVIGHNGDELLAAQVGNAQKLRRGDAWTFGRRGTGAVDAVYAMAAAVHLARLVPAPKPPVLVL